MPVLNAPSGPTHELPGTAFTSLATPTLGSTETSVWKVSIAAGTDPADTQFELSNAGNNTLEAICCMPVGGQARFGDGEAFTPPWAL